MEHNTPENINLTVDGIPVTVPAGTRILEAALKAGVRVPTLCDHGALGKRAVCRICVVEGDGRGKLMAACANEVWEGAKIVTNSQRIMAARKTILELILADHPRECLSCVKNKKCELQNLAADFGIRSSPFETGGGKEQRKTETSGGILVRDMDKCVKCGRCVEACQELQTVRAINSSGRSGRYEISTAYGQALSESPCILCGRCAFVCPVGAIYGHDQSAELMTVLNNKERRAAAQFAPAAIAALEAGLGLSEGSVSAGKLVSALKLLGFEKVADAALFAGMRVKAELDELLGRLKTRDKLPLLSSCSPAFGDFVARFYPDLVSHLSAAKSPEENFSSVIQEWKSPNPPHLSAAEAGAKKSAAVSVAPCLSKKIEARRLNEKSGGNDIFALTSAELVRMIRAAGISPDKLPESPFDSFAGIPAAVQNGAEITAENIIRKVYEAYTGKNPAASPAMPVYREIRDGIREAEIEIAGAKAKVLAAGSLAGARVIMEEIRRGECTAAFVHIMACDSCVG